MLFLTYIFYNHLFFISFLFHLSVLRDNAGLSISHGAHQRHMPKHPEAPGLKKMFPTKRFPRGGPGPSRIWNTAPPRPSTGPQHPVILAPCHRHPVMLLSLPRFYPRWLVWYVSVCLCTLTLTLTHPCNVNF